METWHYLVVGLLVVIAYRLYKIQDVVSGRAKQRQDEDREEEEANQSKPKEAPDTIAITIVVFTGLLLCLWLVFWLIQK